MNDSERTDRDELATLIANGTSADEPYAPIPMDYRRADAILGSEWLFNYAAGVAAAATRKADEQHKALVHQLYTAENKMAQAVIKDILSYAGDHHFNEDVNAYLRMVLKIYVDAGEMLRARGVSADQPIERTCRCEVTEHEMDCPSWG